MSREGIAFKSFYKATSHFVHMHNCRHLGVSAEFYELLVDYLPGGRESLQHFGRDSGLEHWPSWLIYGAVVWA